MGEKKEAKKPWVLKVIDGCSFWSERVGIVLAAGSGFIMLFSLLVGVATRWLPFMTSAIWSEEIARMCMLWLTANGASVAYKRIELVKFNLLVDVFPEKLKYVMEFVSTRISYFWWALGLYIGFVLMAVHTVKFLADHIRGWGQVMKGGAA